MSGSDLLAHRLIVQEVAPRDGLADRADLGRDRRQDRADRRALGRAASRRIEAGSFVSPKAVPALRDGDGVFAGIERRPARSTSALVPNPKGAERALAARADELNLVMSASETHNRANMRMTLRGLARGASARSCGPSRARGASLNATVATAFGCPFEGRSRSRQVLDIVDALSRARGRRRHARRHHRHGQSATRSRGSSPRARRWCLPTRSRCTSTTRAASASPTCSRPTTPARAASTRRSAASADVRSRRAPPATSAPKTS